MIRIIELVLEGLIQLLAHMGDRAQDEKQIVRALIHDLQELIASNEYLTNADIQRRFLEAMSWHNNTLNRIADAEKRLKGGKV